MSLDTMLDWIECGAGYAAEMVAVAGALASVGDFDRAMEWLERAIETPNWNTNFITSDPTFDPMRDTPRFQHLLSRVGLGS